MAGMRGAAARWTKGVVGVWGSGQFLGEVYGVMAGGCGGRPAVAGFAA